MSKVFIINNNEYFSLRTSLVHLAFSISFYLTTYFSQGVSRTLHVPSLFFHHFSLVSHSLFLMYFVLSTLLILPLNSSPGYSFAYKHTWYSFFFLPFLSPSPSTIGVLFTLTFIENVIT